MSDYITGKQKALKEVEHRCACLLRFNYNPDYIEGIREIRDWANEYRNELIKKYGLCDVVDIL